MGNEHLLINQAYNSIDGSIRRRRAPINSPYTKKKVNATGKPYKIPRICLAPERKSKNVLKNGVSWYRKERTRVFFKRNSRSRRQIFPSLSTRSAKKREDPPEIQTFTCSRLVTHTPDQWTFLTVPSRPRRHYRHRARPGRQGRLESRTHLPPSATWGFLQQDLQSSTRLPW